MDGNKISSPQTGETSRVGRENSLILCSCSGTICTGGAGHRIVQQGWRRILRAIKLCLIMSLYPTDDASSIELKLFENVFHTATLQRQGSIATNSGCMQGCSDKNHVAEPTLTRSETGYQTQVGTSNSVQKSLRCIAPSAICNNETTALCESWTLPPALHKIWMVPLLVPSTYLDRETLLSHRGHSRAVQLVLQSKEMV